MVDFYNLIITVLCFDMTFSGMDFECSRSFTTTCQSVATEFRIERFQWRMANGRVEILGEAETVPSFRNLLSDPQRGASRHLHFTQKILESNKCGALRAPPERNS